MVILKPENFIKYILSILSLNMIHNVIKFNVAMVIGKHRENYFKCMNEE